MKNYSNVRWISFVLVTFLHLSAFSQGHTLTAISGTYTPLTGGTAVPAIQTDDAISPTVNIGFNFVFDGITYTQVVASSNGFLSLNISATDSYGNSLSGADANNRPLIAPLWDDLQGNVGIASYKTEGSAPNRIFTFEWLNWKWGYTASAAGISFQAKLYETTNRIEFVYRQESGSLSSPKASIGLAYLTGFCSLNNSSTTPILSYITETATIALKPATGQIYQFNIAKAEPTNHPTVFTAVSNSINITLNWTDATGTILPDGYLILASTTNSFTDPVDYTDITADNNMTDGLGQVKVLQGVQTYSSFTNLQLNSTYYFRIYPYSNSGSLINYKTTVTVPQSSVSFTAKAEPTNHVTGFNAISNGTSINLTWIDAAGAIVPDGYLILASITNSFTDPIDLTDITADEDMSDGVGKVKVVQGVQSYSGFANMQYNNIYYFRIYPYSNSGAYINYKTTATVPQTSVNYIPKAEPTNHTTFFTAAYNNSIITLSWMDAIGTVQPDGYLIIASTTNSFTDPVDLIDITADNDMSDGVGNVKVAKGIQSYTGFTNFQYHNTYYFRIYPYSNSGSFIDYKITATVPQATVYYFKPEPTNHAAGFKAFKNTNAIILNWTDAIGTIVPDGYLIMASKTTSFTDPFDGVDPTTDNDLSDGNGIVKVAYGAQTYSGWLNAKFDSTYYFVIYPYSNTGAWINYKTSSTVPQIKVTPQTTFTEQTGMGLPGIWYSLSSWADFDNDGDLDLLLIGHSGGPVTTKSVFRNNGDNTFTEIAGIGLPIVMDGSLACGDYDNDGDIDILLTGKFGEYPDYSISSKVYKNNGDLTFTEQTNISLQGVFYSKVAWGDYDNDGDLDILLTGATVETYSKYNEVSKIYRNNGNNSFTEQTSISLTGIFSGSVEWGDYDNDGDLDILMSGSTGGYVPTTKIYRNNSNNSFTELGGTSLKQVGFGTAAWGDYDNDGDLDILLTGDDYNYYQVCSIYRNNGNSTFTEQTDITLAKIRGKALWGDYDNDGKLDILLMGYYSGSGTVTKLYKNKGNNQFVEQTDISNLTGGDQGTVAWGDYDNDGDLDIAITGNSGGGMGTFSKIYRNECMVLNGLPAAPIGINQTVTGAEAKLSWKKVTTSLTPSKAITYNVQVGTSSNAINTVSPQSGSNGFRRIVAMGNGQLDTTFTIKNIKKGTYFWRVQAIDNSFKGGAFSTEGSFTISGATQAFGVATRFVGADSAQIIWSRGSLDKCIVLAKEGADVPVAPNNNSPYTASTVFGSGTQVGTSGWICIYNGTDESVKVTGLKPVTNYAIRVFEYDGNPGNEDYCTTLSNSNLTTFKTYLFKELTGANLAGVSNGSAISGDYDNDGKLDVLITGSGIAKIYHNEGNNVFTEQTSIILTGVGNSSAAWGDYNNDGNLDFIITGSGTSKIYRNNGDKSFTEQTTIIIAGVDNGSAAWGDYDNDGDLDIVITGSGITKIYRNNGDNSFTEQSGIALPGLSYSSVSWGDYDNDGDLDILLSGTKNSQTFSRIYRNEGDNQFSERTEINLLGVSGGNSSWGDYDNDGDLDIMVSTDNSFAVFSNNNNGTFVYEVGIKSSGGSAAWGDYDNDGLLDIVTVGPNSKVYKNDGDNNFIEQTNIQLPNVTSGTVAWSDFDNDGDLDILLSGSGISRIYRNDGSVFNTSPETPVGIEQSVTGADVTLRWKPVKTDNTSANSITYNVKVGTVSNSINITSPQAAANGVRKIVEMGNGQLDTTYTLKKLRKGTYFWSVQAIDNSFASSPFSTEGTFTISEPLQAYGLSVKANAKDAILQWTRGYSEKCIVFAKEGEAGKATPLNNTSYNASSIFGEGSQIETSGWFCIYNGVSDAVVLTGLKALTKYTFQVFEYEGNLGSELYSNSIGSFNPFTFITDVFTDQTSILLPIAVDGGAVWGDYDNDGYLDIAISSRSDNGSITKVYHNNGDNTFSELSGVSLEGDYGGSPYWGDYNYDGNIDIRVTGYNSSKVFRNDGNGSFTYQADASTNGFYSGSGEWGDIDNDGDLDKLVMGSINDGTISRIALNNGNDTYTEQPNINLDGISNGKVNWGDYDSDGDLDLLVTCSGFTKIMRNESLAKNIAPIAPTGVSQVVSGAEVTLKWNPIVSDGVHNNAVTYNLKFGTTSGGMDITSTLSSVAGVRRIAANGNNLTDTSLNMKNLKKGTYYWSVQAVDYSYAGGPFSSEGNFSITESAQASNLSASSITANSAKLSWKRGNLASCVVFAKTGSGGNAMPENNTTYNASATLGIGSQIGTSGWFCIYNGTADAIQLLGLQFSTEYTIKVFEYEGTPGNELYLTTNTSSNTYSFTSNLFSEQSVTINEDYLGKGDWVDYDNDGDLDFSMVGQSNLKIYTNNGDNTFTEQNLLNGTQTRSIAWGDYDNDGDLDAVVSGTQYSPSYKNFSSIYRNNGNKTFTLQSDISLRVLSGGNFAWGDYDNDGDLDLLQTGYDDSYTSFSLVYSNNGDNSFTEQTSISLFGVAGGTSSWGDYDNDGYLDILLVDESYGAKIYRNNGNNNFIEQTTIDQPRMFYASAFWGDYDSDGDLDILLTGETLTGKVSTIYRNEGNNTFTNQTEILLDGFSQGSSAWGDYDNDGDLDILLTGSCSAGSISKLYRNNSDNTFTEQIFNSLPGGYNSYVRWGDYDNDGDLDALLVGGGNNKLYQNQTIKVNTKPGKPINLSSSKVDGNFILNWDQPAEIDETPFKGLSYNVRLGRTSKGNQIVSAQVSTTGSPCLARPGNVGSNNFLKLKVKPGIYYWSVQAIDNSFIGGAFSDEKTVSIDSIQASGIEYRTISNSEVSLSWKRGNGDRSVVFCKRGTDIGGAKPEHLKSYIGDEIFEMGDQIGNTGWFCIFNGRADSTVLKGLLPNTKYSVYIAEYLGSKGNEMYYRELNNNNFLTFSPGLFVIQSEYFDQKVDEIAAVWGDSDNDRDLDIVFKGNVSIGGFGQSIDAFASYSNNGNNTFTLKNYTPDTWYGSTKAFNSIAGGDYDNDGDLDYLLSGLSTSSGGSKVGGEWVVVGTPETKIYRNNGDNTFLEQTRIVFDQVAMGASVWGDYDNDGDLDLLITGASNVEFDETGKINVTKAISKIYKNNGNKTFTEQKEIILTDVYNSSVAWGDYDNDGHLDILLTGKSTSGPISKIYRNSGNNSFVDQTSIVLTGVTYGSAVWGDYDNDGDLDILLTGLNSKDLPISKIYLNNGDNTFTEKSDVGLIGVYQSSAAWGDYDNDGDLDILLAGETSTTKKTPITKIYKNNGNNTFIEQEYVISGVYGGSSGWGDYDNDGDLDILLTGFTASSKVFAIYRNTTISNKGDYPSNSIPLKPSNLSAIQTPGKVTLSWDRLTTDETPALSMSYNVRLYKVESNGSKKLVVSPQATNSGNRTITGLGNTQLNNSYSITNLPMGFYEWNVQAIDQEYSGGAWSDVNSFEIKSTQAYFSATKVCAGSATSFTNTSAASNGIASSKWYFGDDSTSVEFSPKHFYTLGKTYTVSLVITDTKGIRDSISFPVEVKPGPNAIFNAPAVCQGNATAFTNTSLIPNDLSVSSWKWNFGDGTQNSQPTVQNPGDYTFLKADTFNVSLILVANNGCTDTTKNDVIVAPMPLATIFISSDSKFSFCKNSGEFAKLSLNLQANCTYQWLNNGVEMNGETNKDLTVIENGGSFKATVTNSVGGCSITSPTAVQITVNNSPAKPAIIYNNSLTTFCQGDSLVMQTSIDLGNTLQWSLNGGVVSNKTVYAAKQNGTYTLKVTNSNNCSAIASETVVVIVNPSPQKPLISPTSARVCMGNSVVLSVQSTNGLTYQWQKNNADIIGATSTQYSASTEGSYSLMIKNSSSQCYVETEPVSVVVDTKPDPPIALSSHLTYCPSDTVKLSLKDTPLSYNYYWKRNGVVISNAPVYKGLLTSGDYILVVENGNCSVESNKITLTSKPALEKPNIVYRGRTRFILACTNMKASKYVWEYNGSLIEGAKSYQYYANTKLGKYQVEIFAESGCSTKSDITNIPTNGKVIESDILTDNSVVVYPNPSNGIFNFSLDHTYSGQLDVQIADALGIIILQKQFQESNGFTIDLTEFINGVYYCKISYQNNLVTKKIIKL